MALLGAVGVASLACMACLHKKSMTTIVSPMIPYMGSIRTPILQSHHIVLWFGFSGGNGEVVYLGDVDCLVHLFSSISKHFLKSVIMCVSVVI